MVMLEMYVRNMDGTGRVEQRERADDAGRRMIDKAALDALLRSGTDYVVVRPVRRYGSGGAR